MKTALEILRFLDERATSAILRPHMYAASPESLEEMLSFMDQIRQFTLSEEGSSQTEGGYTAFLVSEGYGSATFCGRNLIDSGQMPSFSAVAEIWEKYMKSPFFPRAGLSE